MKAMTISGFDEPTLKAIKERARKEGTSINSVLLKIIQEEVGLKKKARSRTYTDLDHLAGTWSKREFKTFERRMEDFERVDENMWK